MLNNIVKCKNSETSTVHIVRRHYKRYGSRMYCGVQDRISKFGSPRDFKFSITDCQPTCKTCIKTLVSIMRKNMDLFAEKFNDVHTRYVLATIGGGDQEYRPIAFDNDLEFNNLQDAIDERNEMADSEGIIIVKEIREILNI